MKAKYLSVLIATLVLSSPAGAAETHLGQKIKNHEFSLP